jgi:hypothetical protein
MYILYNLQTILVAMVVLLSGVCLSRLSPVFGEVAAIGFIVYIGQRQNKLKWKKIKDRKPGTEDTMSLINNFSESINRYNSCFIEYKGCRTCGTAYYSVGNPTCLDSDLPRHNVLDEPPAGNPYEFWWYQVNGYPPPTEFNAPDEPQKLIIEGKKYYMDHRNTAWYMGVSIPPSWYVDKDIANISK